MQVFACVYKLQVCPTRHAWFVLGILTSEFKYRFASANQNLMAVTFNKLIAFSHHTSIHFKKQNNHVLASNNSTNKIYIKN